MRPIFSALAVLALVFLAVAARAEDHAAGNHPTGDHPDREFKECQDCPQMVAIPAGQFTMGSPASEHGRFDSEGPQHKVTIRAFALGKYDVTSEEFLNFLKETRYEPPPCDPMMNMGWHSRGRGLAEPPFGLEPLRWPAVCLNWYDAQAYIAWINRKAGGKETGPYRLPTEAEWEYAARAGTIAARWWGEAIGSGQANCNGCGSKVDGRELALVDSFAPNPFGLYGMLGNVWQWTADCWHESYVDAPTDGSAWTAPICNKRVLRGGSWSNVPAFIRSAARSRAEAGGGDFDYSSYAGFRVARNLP